MDPTPELFAKLARRLREIEGRNPHTSRSPRRLRRAASCHRLRHRRSELWSDADSVAPVPVDQELRRRSMRTSSGRVRVPSCFKDSGVGHSLSASTFVRSYSGRSGYGHDHFDPVKPDKIKPDGSNSPTRREELLNRLRAVEEERDKMKRDLATHQEEAAARSAELSAEVDRLKSRAAVLHGQLKLAQAEADSIIEARRKSHCEHVTMEEIHAGNVPTVHETDDGALVNELQDVASEKCRLQYQLQSLRVELELQEASKQVCKDRLCVNYSNRRALAKKLSRLGSCWHVEEPEDEELEAGLAELAGRLKQDPEAGNDLLGCVVALNDLDLSFEDEEGELEAEATVSPGHAPTTLTTPVPSADLPAGEDKSASPRLACYYALHGDDCDDDACAAASPSSNEAHDLELAFDWGLDLATRMPVDRVVEFATWAAQRSGSHDELAGDQGDAEDDPEGHQDTGRFEPALVDLQAALATLQRSSEHQVQPELPADAGLAEAQFEKPMADLQAALALLCGSDSAVGHLDSKTSTTADSEIASPKALASLFGSLSLPAPSDEPELARELAENAAAPSFLESPPLLDSADETDASRESTATAATIVQEFVPCYGIGAAVLFAPLPARETFARQFARSRLPSLS